MLAKLPPLSISVTRITGAEQYSAILMFAISYLAKFISAGEPAPSSITISYFLRNTSRDSFDVERPVVRANFL